ncbi:aldo/keto reductase [Bifidobacterium pullorum]|nr:aldo/keto reductase [Bifidobacterium pullorum]
MTGFTGDGRPAAATRTVALPDGGRMPAIGMGTWHMGEDRASEEDEAGALCAGMAAGMRLIDTAEMYADGDTERVVGAALKKALHGGVPGLTRDDLFVVDKVLPEHAGADDVRRSCEASLNRLGTEYLDLYLLHWRGDVPLAETVAEFRKLCDEGLIRRWGVSNLDVPAMEELMAVPGGDGCATDQVLYHLGSRGVEVALQPWLRTHRMPMMAYSPLAQGGTRSRRGLFQDPTVRAIAQHHQATPAQVLLAWVLRDDHTVAIPMASSITHAQQNAAAAALRLTEEDLTQLDEAFPAPTEKQPLDWL